MTTIPDAQWIDLLRGAAVATGILLLVVLGWLRLHMPDVLPQRARQAIYALILLVLPVLFTEVQQIGKPLIVWRLPLSLLAFICALWWAIRAAGDD